MGGAAAEAAHPRSRPRLRRALGVALAALALLLLVAALGGWWLLASAGGRDLALQRVVAALPDGTLRIGEREGSVAGGLRLRDVVFENASARIEIDVLTATPRFPGLRTRAVNLAALRVQGVRVTLKAAPDAPAPPWPQRLPALDLPLTLRIEAVDIRDVQLVLPADDAPSSASSASAPRAPLRIDTASAALALSPGRLALDALSISSPLGRVEGRIAYAPVADFRTDVDVRSALTAGAHLTLRVEGDLAGGRATLDGVAGGPLSLALDWQDARTLEGLGWALMANAERLLPATLGLAAATGVTPDVADAAPIDLQLNALGGIRVEPSSEPGLRIALEGRVAQGEHAVQLRDSRLRLANGVLHAEPLALDLLDGRLDIDGDYRLADGAMALQARAAGLAWGEGEARVRASGELTLHGSREAWTALLDLALARGAQRAQLEAAARGSAEAIVLAPFTLRTQGGALQGEARYGRGEADFALQARLHNVDPAWLLPGWPGSLDGHLRVEGVAAAQAPRRWRADATELRGRLRGQAVAGRASAEARGEALRIETDLVLGAGRISAGGAIAPTLDLDATLRTLDLAPWIDGARGVLDGRLRLRGSTARPALDADLVVLDAGWGGFSVQRVTARGAVPARGEGRFVLRADRLAQGGSRAESIELILEGALDAGRYALAARGIDVPNLPAADAASHGVLSARGQWAAAARGADASLVIEALDARLPRLPMLALDAPTRIVGLGAGKRPSWCLTQSACLGVGVDGRLCLEGDADDLRLDATALDLASLAPFLPEDADTPLAPSGRVNLQASLRRGLPGWRATLGAQLLPGGRIDAHVVADAAGALEGGIALRFTDLAFLEALSTGLVAPRGVIEGELRIAGSIEQPRWSGAIAAAPLAVELPALGIAVVDGELRLQGDDDGQLRLRGRLPTGDGALELAGAWSDDARPNTLTIGGSDVRVLDTPDGRAWISPALEVEIVDGIARLRGRVDVPRAELALDRFEQGVAVSDDVVVIDDPDVGATTAGLALDADVILALGEDVRLSGFGFEGGLGGELRIRDRVDRTARARGTLTLDGKVRAYGQQLDLERGLLRWSNVAIDEPTLDVRAVRPDSEPEVGLAVSGTAGAPVVEVWSRPPLPQAEALSWLMFGRPLASADGADAAQIEQAATTLGGSAVAQAVAGRVGLDTASIGPSRALGGTALTVGKRLTPRLHVSYGLSLSGVGQIVTVTYAIRRWLAVQFETGIEQRVELEASVDRD